MFGGFDKSSDIDVLLLSFHVIMNRDEFFSKFAVYLGSEECGATILQKIP